MGGLLSGREILNAILYVLKTGCAWHLLPHDFPPYSTVFLVFSPLAQRGCLGTIEYRFTGKSPSCSRTFSQPSAVIIDSQSVKTTEKGG
jgi:transposase